MVVIVTTVVAGVENRTQFSTPDAPHVIDGNLVVASTTHGAVHFPIVNVQQWEVK